jgi:hypothetical protein
MTGEFGGTGADDEVTEYIAETEVVGTCDRWDDDARSATVATLIPAAMPQLRKIIATANYADADVS